MKLEFVVSFDIKSDWNRPFFTEDGSGNRQRFVADQLRKTTLVGVANGALPAVSVNGVSVYAISISDPQWIDDEAPLAPVEDAPVEADPDIAEVEETKPEDEA